MFVANDDIERFVSNRVIQKVITKTLVCILKEEKEHQTFLSTKLFYAPKRDKKKFGPEYEATNE